MTKDDLSQPGKLISLHACANRISHLVTCLIAIPAFPENKHIRDSYFSELEKAVGDMKEACNG